MDAIKKMFADKSKAIEFGYRLKSQFDVNEINRRPKELEWLESLRQVKGIYDPDVKIADGNSKVYPKITRSKINIVLSRLHEMLFPENDKNWEVLPTPEPKISEAKVVQIGRSLIQQDPETGEQILPTESELNLAIKAYAKKTCELMSSEMDDQFIEMDYAEETKKVLRSGLTYGTGVMKGVLINARNKRKWSPSESGGYAESTETEGVPFFEAVRLWDWYPDMSVTDLDTMEGSFERHIMTKHDLRGLMKRSDFYGDIVKKYIAEHPSGDYVAKNWEVDLQVIDVQAGADKTSASVQGNDDDSRSTYRQIGKKYQVLEFWGYVDGSDLQACGVEVSDVSLEYAANIWLLGGVPIKVALYEGVLDKYKVFYYEKDETSIFGEGLARVMRHSAISIAASARMVLDNASCVAGPQVEVNMSLLAPDTDVDGIYPRKIWFREGRGIEAQYPAIRSIEFQSHIDDLLKIIETFKNFADEETTLPTWMIGQMVSNETAQAASGRMSTITVSIKDVVKNFDAFTEKIIQDLYTWNMEFNPREDIKGDYMCKARGVSSLVMKEIRMQAIAQLSTTMTPEDWLYVDRREFLKEKFKAHDINLELRTEEEVERLRAIQQESTQAKLAIQLQEAEIGYKKATTMAQLAKARDKNVDSAVKVQGGEDEAGSAQADKTRIETELLIEKNRREEETHKEGKDAKIEQSTKG